MRPKWPKLASLTQKKYVYSSFSFLVQSLLPKDTLLRTYYRKVPRFQKVTLFLQYITITQSPYQLTKMLLATVI